MCLFCRCISCIHPMYLGCTPLSFFRVCLFGVEIGWMENFGDKMGKKTFFGVCLVEWGGKKINCGPQVFSPLAHQKVLSLK